jgi:hypothetical protein
LLGLSLWLASGSATAQLTPQAYAPPAPDLRPWYFEQRLALLGVVVGLVALFALELYLRGANVSTRVALQRARMFVLLCVFGVVAVWGFGRQARREARRSWGRPLHVAVVLLCPEPLDEPVVQAFRQAAGSATRFVQIERARYASDVLLARGTAPFDRGPPIYFHVLGPIAPETMPATPAPGSSLWSELAQHLALLRTLRAIDRQVGLASERYDERMYVHARRAQPGRAARFVEGVGEAGGEVGVVSVDLDVSMVQAAWTAVIHEVLHTLGASDKYDASGRALYPDGFAEPARVPPYPQRLAEIMVGEIPLAPDRGKLPLTLDQVRVGASTAREIGWR